ncbi:MAG: substrate-binding domain-containing protein [Pontiella sp.]
MDNHQLGKNVAAYLIEKGLRRFAATAWSIKGPSGQLKIQGFIGALKPYGYDVIILETHEALLHADRTLNVQKGEPFGFFAAEDFLGRMVIDTCEMTGLRVPEDVAVIGGDNSPFICDAEAHYDQYRAGCGTGRLSGRRFAGPADPGQYDSHGTGHGGARTYR